MKALLTKTSDWDFKKKIEVETIEDILKLLQPRVVIGAIQDYDKKGKFKDCEIEIEIYDDWRE